MKYSTQKAKLGIVTLLLFVFISVFPLHKAILEKFADDTLGSNPPINIKNLSPELLDVYLQWGTKPTSDVGHSGSIVYSNIIAARPEMEQRVKQFHLAPMDRATMRALELCPLFNFNPKAEKITPLYSMYLPKKDLVQPQYSYFSLDKEPDCVVYELTHQLIQYRSLSQGAFEEQAKTVLNSGLCAGHSLHNIMLLHQYVETGNQQYLKDMHDFVLAYSFLDRYIREPWLEIKAVKESVQLLKEKSGENVPDITVVSTALLFDPALEHKQERQAKGAFAYFDRAEYDYVQTQRKKIFEGLKNNDTYQHFIIIGNEETVAGAARGHYFAFAIIKKGDHVQYIVTDTSTFVYHLQKGSHERNRLQLIIDCVKTGFSSIDFAYLPHILGTQPGAFGSGDMSDQEIEQLIEEKLTQDGPDIGECNTLIDQIMDTKGATVHSMSPERLLAIRETIGAVRLLSQQKNAYSMLLSLITQEIEKRGLKGVEPQGQASKSSSVPNISPQEVKIKSIVSGLSENEKNQLVKEKIGKNIFFNEIKNSKDFDRLMTGASAIGERIEELDTLINNLIKGDITLDNMNRYTLEEYQGKIEKMQKSQEGFEFKKYLPQNPYKNLLELIDKAIEQKTAEEASLAPETLSQDIKSTLRKERQAANNEEVFTTYEKTRKTLNQLIEDLCTDQVQLSRIKKEGSESSLRHYMQLIEAWNQYIAKQKNIGFNEEFLLDESIGGIFYRTLYQLLYQESLLRDIKQKK